MVNHTSTSFLILINSFLYARFGTTLLEVLSDSSNSTHESSSIVKDFIKYTIFDCFTTYQKIGILVKIFANVIFHKYVESISLNRMIAQIIPIINFQ